MTNSAVARCACSRWSWHQFPIHPSGAKSRCVPWYFGENSTKMLRFATLFSVVCLAVGILNGAEVSPDCFVAVVPENPPEIFI